MQKFAPFSRHIARLAACLFVAGMFSGCAVFNSDNTPALNLVRKHLVPESKGNRILALPVILPVGAVAGVVDAAVIHPVSVLDDAAIDTKSALWSNFDWEEEYVTACVGLPWRAVFSVPAFAGAYFGRVLFDIPDHEAPERAAAEIKQAIKMAHGLIEEGKPVLALRALSRHNLRPLLQSENHEEILADFEIAALEAAWKAGRYKLMQPTWQTPRILDGAKGDALRDLIKRIRTEGDPLARWQATSILIAASGDAERRVELVREALSDESAAYRMLALQWMSGGLSVSDAMRVRKDLAHVAAGDDDPTNRAFAKSLLSDLVRSMQQPPRKGAKK